MPTRAIRRLAAPLLVVAGAALFGLGAGGVAGVHGRLDAATRQLTPPRQQAPPLVDTHRDVRDDHRHGHYGEF